MLNAGVMLALGPEKESSKAPEAPPVSLEEKRWHHYHASTVLQLKYVVNKNLELQDMVCPTYLSFEIQLIIS